MKTALIAPSRTKTPIAPAPQVDPQVKPKRDRNEMLDEIAQDCFVNPEEYLQHSAAPKGE